jgi:prophage antirepressor-like protein
MKNNVTSIANCVNSDNNPVTTFESEMFGQVRTMTIEGSPWFVATDVCRALEIKNCPDAVNRLDEDEKFTTIVSNDTAATGKSSLAYVNEPGLYTLVLGSRKPQAKAFKRWITHEVIPQIRKTGGYIPVDAKDDEVTTLSKALEIAARTLELKDSLLLEKEKLIKVLLPVEEKYNRMMNSEKLVSLNTVAKLVGTGRSTLMKEMREDKILMKRNTDGASVPTQAYINRGYMTTKMCWCADGTYRPVCKVTRQGLDFLCGWWQKKHPSV